MMMATSLADPGTRASFRRNVQQARNTRNLVASAPRATLAAEQSTSGELAPYYFPDGWKKLEGAGLVATRVAASAVAFGVLPISGIPPEVRLAALTYGLASTAEWGYHKFDMHENDEVHILHHAETNTDMSMPSGFNIDAIQFPRSASIRIVVTSAPVLAAFDIALHLNIPVWEVLPAALLIAISHAGLWNTLHPDSHDVVLADDERMSDSNGTAYIQWLSTALGETALYKWLIVNHTGHHTIRGNYNCVFPGMDAVFGTYYTPKETAQ